MDFDFGRAFKAYLDATYGSENKTPTVGRYWPSQLGYCLRRQWFRFRKPKPPRPDSYRYFERGNMFHEWVSYVLSRAPGFRLLSSERSLSIVDYQSDPPFVLDGRLDDFLLVEDQEASRRILIEVKTTERSLSKLEKPDRPHLLQVQPYILSAHADEAYILYLRPNLESKTFRVEYDPVLMEELMQRGKTLDACLRMGVPPVAEGKRDPDLRWECEKRCEYRAECDALELSGGLEEA